MLPQKNFQSLRTLVLAQYSWNCHITHYISAGSSTLTLENITSDINIQCHVTYAADAGLTLGGSLTSDTMSITVNDITTNPQDKTVVIGTLIISIIYTSDGYQKD